ncbi:hypothetical protein FACS1894125_6330 [Actinomycetota bacterium]|nr:hypothetical protein FACS1894125_6330 [Actinomycetota bacterium]
MANKKDFQDAAKYANNRLITAFVSGRPENHELEPKNYLTSFIAGIAVCVLLVAGSLIYGIIKPGLSSGWENNKLIVTQTGSRYISKDSVIYPVLNLTSARLLIPSNDWTVISTSDDKLVGVKRGETVGIKNAPDYLPGSSDLVREDWNSCLISNVAETSLGEKSSKELSENEVAVFISESEYYLIADGLRYTLPEKSAERENLLDDFGVSDFEVQKSTTAWLNLFPNGEIASLEKQKEKFKEKKLKTNEVLCATVVDGSTRLSVSDSFVPSPPIKPGKGALYRAGAQLFYIGDDLVNYPIVDGSEETVKQLGWKNEDVLSIPQFWSNLFLVGPELSKAEAEHNVAGFENSSKSTTAASSNADADSVAQCDADEKVKNVPTYYQQLSLSDVHKYTTGEGVIVAVVDSGVDKNNPHLRDAVLPGIDLVSNTGSSDGSTDELGHGTAIASLIAGREVDGSALVGVAPEAKILPVRVFVTDEEAQRERQSGPDPAKIAQGIRYAADSGADIINVSMSTNTDESSLRTATAYAQNKGSIVVASSGNRNTSQDTSDSVRYPAAYSGVIGVAAVDDALHSTDSSIHNYTVDISAPGQNISAAQKRGIDCTYAVEAPSSSFSTALVSGTAALVKSKYADIPNAEIEYRLESSASRPDADSRDNLIGWGVVQPISALDMIAASGNRGPNYVGFKNASLFDSGVVREPFKDAAADMETPIIDTISKLIFVVAMFLLIMIGLFWKALSAECEIGGEDNDI